MKNKIILIPILAITAIVTFLFIGIDKNIGDHEMGISYDLFIKHKPSLKIEYSNPAHKNLEMIPFNGLDTADKKEFIEYCAIRFGISDTDQCYALFEAEQI